MTTDLRVVERDICEIEAKVRIAHGRALECLVVDISEDGAKIEIDPSEPLPSFFTLTLPETASISHDRPVELRWRVANMAGLRFIGARTQ